MDYVLKGLEPAKCFFFFEEISRIPRSSYEEQAIAQYVMDFAVARGLRAYEDAAHNVYVSKPATPGYEDHKGVILQAHMDMVCVSDPGVEHDFTKDPLELAVDGDWVYAKGTTLGADDGAGVAMMLAILDSDDVEHPALQCLFTTAEEVGLVGASKLEPERLEGEYLINLDGGSIDRLLTTSAGSSVHLYTVDEAREPLDPNGQAALEVSIHGLTSGHSGALAHKGYGNAIKLTAELLASLMEKVHCRLASFTGGLKMNAIPKEAKGVIVVAEGELEKALSLLADAGAAIRKEYHRTDPEMVVCISTTELPDTVFGADAQDKLVTLIDQLPDGVFLFYNDEKSMAKTSCNIGILESRDGRTVATCLMRSNSNYEHNEWMRRADRLAKLIGVRHQVLDPSYAWEGEGTPLIERVAALHEAEFGTKPEFVQGHGGVEIGTILGLAARANKTMYAVNFGAATEDVHTTRERLSIKGMQSAFTWLKHVIRNLD